MIPDDIVHVNLHYTLGAPGALVEEANWGFHLQFVDDDGGVGSVIDWQPAIEALAGDVNDSHSVNFWDNVRSHFPVDVRPNTVKVTHLDNNRHALHIASHGLSGSAGSASVPLPYETSTCISLYGYEPGTFAADRARKRGRFYLPPMSNGTMDVGGVIKDEYVHSLSEALDAFLNDLQGKRVEFGSPSVDAGYWRLVVVSGIGAGLATQVEAVGVGRVPDSQRRRRRSQSEAPRLLTTIDHS